MQVRVLLRVVLSLVIIVLVLFRAVRGWHYESRWWLFGSLALSVILALVVVSELLGVRQRWQKYRDEVPKKPLGLD